MSDTEQIGSRMSLFRPHFGSGRHDRSWKYGTSVRYEQGRVNTELSAANDSKAAFPQQPCHRGDQPRMMADMEEGPPEWWHQ